MLKLMHFEANVGCFGCISTKSAGGIEKSETIFTMHLAHLNEVQLFADKPI